MALLLTEAQKLSNNTLERGVIEEIIDRDELFALLPFFKIASKAYVYNRENTISEGDFLDPYDVVNEGAATFTTLTANLKILAGDVDIDKFIIATTSDTNDQVAIQLAQKSKALARKLRRTIVNGNSGGGSKEFDGLNVLTPGSQILTAGTNGASVTLSMLDELLDVVKNGVDCLMMRRGTWRALRALMRATGGITPEMIQVPNFGHAVPAYNGIPVIINDFMSGTETTGSNSLTCSVYALHLSEVDGFTMLYGGDSAGVVVEDIGTVQNKDCYRYRVKWYVSAALKSTQSVGRVVGVTNV